MAPKLSKNNHGADRDFGIGSCIIGAAAAILLAVTLLAAGFAACTTPVATRVFSSAFADYDTTPYLPDDVVELAVATRDYTVEDCGRSNSGIEAAREPLCHLIVDSARRAAAPDSPIQSRWNAPALTVLDDENLSDSETAYELAQVSDRYALSEEALSHLDDCYALISKVTPWLAGIAIAALAMVIALVASGRRKLAGNVLFFSPIALAAFMALCGIWAAADFYGFFKVFHMLFFPQGNWSFPAESLLICMLPLNFWVSMGALWLAVTVLACIIAMLIGKQLRRPTR